MQAEKIESGDLSRAFRKAFLSGLLVLGVGMGMTDAQTSQQSDPDQNPHAQNYNRNPDQNPAAADSTATEAQSEPWQSDPNYIREMDAAQKNYEARVEYIRKSAALNETRIQNQKKVNTVRLWTSGRIRPIYDVVQTKALKTQAKANVDLVEARAEDQIANLHMQYVRQAQNIEARYKVTYERQQQQNQKAAAAPSTSQQKQINSGKREVSVETEQMKLEKEKLKLEQEKLKIEQERLKIAQAKKKLEAPPVVR